MQEEKEIMYAIMKDKLYRYSDAYGETELLTFDSSKVDASFSLSKHNCFTKVVEPQDNTISDIYMIDYLVGYVDSVVQDETQWYVSEQYPSDEPYSIDNGEICLYTSWSHDEGGWHSMGREGSFKIIKLSDCTEFVVEYSYDKYRGELQDSALVQRSNVSKDEFVKLVKKHRTKTI